MKPRSHIVEATPDRLPTILGRDATDLSRVMFVVFDEAVCELHPTYVIDLSFTFDVCSGENRETLIFLAIMTRSFHAVHETLPDDADAFRFHSRENRLKTVYVLDQRYIYPCQPIWKSFMSSTC